MKSSLGMLSKEFSYIAIATKIENHLYRLCCHMLMNTHLS
jgi:hypothetical protein